MKGKLAEPRDDRRADAAGKHAAWARTCSINLIGAFSIQFDGVVKPVLSRKLRALVAYLCFRKDGSETRERLAGLLWSERDPDRARASLRQTVRDLHALFGQDAARMVISSKLAVGLSLGSIAVDVDEVMHAAEQGRAHPVLLANDQPVATMLADIEDIDPEFRVWLTAKRRACTDRIIHLLERTFSTVRAGDSAVSAVNAEAVLALDGSHELAARTLMSHYASRGEEARALRIYADLWNLLADHLDAEPSPATQRLVVEIKREKVFYSEPVATPDRLQTIALRVQAVDRGNADEELSFRLKAFRQQLVASLVRFREWSVFDEADQIIDGPEQNAEPQDFRIEISATIKSGGAGIAIALRQRQAGPLIWTETVDFGNADWTEAYSKTVRRIALTLNIHVSSAILKQIADLHAAPPGIYDRWLRAHAIMMSYDSARWDDAGRMLRRIVNEAPDFSLGFRSLAMWSNAHHIAVPGRRREQMNHQDVANLAWRAVELDPSDSRAHLCLAWSLVLAGQAEAAKAHAAMAIELNANDAWTLVSSANILGFCGDVAGAVSAADLALAVSPLRTRTHLCYDAHVRFMCGDHAECLRMLDRSGKGYPGAMAWKVAALVGLSRREEASDALIELLAEVSLAWSGPGLSEDAAFEWLISQFPILDASIKDRFDKALALAREPL